MLSRVYLRALLFTLVLHGTLDPRPAVAEAAQGSALRCVAFSPYVADYDPDLNRHPPPQLIARLLDEVHARGFNCIQTYGVLNGLEYIFEAAKTRGIKIFAILWLDLSPVVNDASIAKGIELARTYADTVVRISCGSEMRVRHGNAADSVVRDCLARLRAAGVTQPLTANDTWWSWCNQNWPCQVRAVAADVDWIGVNVFPWWENKFSGLFPCTTAAEADEFHLARLQDVVGRYPGKEIVLTEYGWPGGPEGHTEKNVHTGQACGTAGQANQQLVRETTTAALEEAGYIGVSFEAFREPWKERHEGPVGGFWGWMGGVPSGPPISPQNFRIVP